MTKAHTNILEENDKQYRQRKGRQINKEGQKERRERKCEYGQRGEGDRDTEMHDGSVTTEFQSQNDSFC